MRSPNIPLKLQSHEAYIHIISTLLFSPLSLFFALFLILWTLLILPVSVVEHVNSSPTSVSEARSPEVTPPY